MCPKYSFSERPLFKLMNQRELLLIKADGFDAFIFHEECAIATRLSFHLNVFD